MDAMFVMFGELSRRTSPYTSYFFDRRSSERNEPSWPVVPVTKAVFAIRGGKRVGGYLHIARERAVTGSTPRGRG